MSKIRIAGLDQSTVTALKAAAKRSGRSVQAYVREILREAPRSGADVDPDWVGAGFDEVHELAPRRQYLVWVGAAPYRLTITRSLVGGVSEWGALVEELVQLPDRDLDMMSVWSHVPDVAQPPPGSSRKGALSHVMHWVSAYAGVAGTARKESLPTAGRTL